MRKTQKNKLIEHWESVKPEFSKALVKQISEDLLKAKTEDERNRLRAIQNSWDNKMKSAGSRYNRFVLAQTFFWEHFHQNWKPAIEEFSNQMKKKAEEPLGKKVDLKLVKK